MSLKRRLSNKLVTLLAVTLVGPAVYFSPASAQDATPETEGGGNSRDPLNSLFTPQPQYPTPQTIMNPEPVPLPGQDNPLKALYTPQPQYPTPQTIMNPQPAEPPGTSNPLNGLYTPQPQYPTPQTLMNPEPVPKNYEPEVAPTESTPPPVPPATPSAQPAQPVAPKPKAAPPKKKAPAKKKPAKKPAATTTVVPPPAYNPLKDALFNINLGQYQTSIDIVNKLLQNDPNNAEAHYTKAVALVFLNKFGDAAQEYRKVMALSPNSDLARRAEEGLKKLNQ